MIEEPTTEQILLECCRELSEVVLPALDDETVKVSVLMLDLVLRNAALRAAHEIAWMHEEIVDLETFAAAVLAARPDAFSVREALDVSIGAGANATSLHLDDVVDRYRLASEAFSRAMEAAVSAGDRALEVQGAAVLERRCEHETVAMAGWSPVGR